MSKFFIVIASVATCPPKPWRRRKQSRGRISVLWIASSLALLAMTAVLPARAADKLGNPTLVPDKHDSAAITDNFSGEVTAQPVCFNVVNQAGYTVQGTFSTDFYKTPEGIAARHQANFRLGAAQQTNFCAAGPFYPGRKLELVIRTLVPVFRCYTAINGDIVIHGKRNDHDDGNVTWVDCR